MRAHSKLILLVLVILAIFSCPAPSEAQWTLYDDFSSGVIDPAKWFGLDGTGGRENPTAESARIIKSRKLELLVTQYGRDDTDIGTTPGTMGLFVTDPTNIKGLQARVIVRAADTESCATNTSIDQRGRALIQGRFFNDGTSPGPGNQIGDTFAVIQKMQDSILGAVIGAFFLRCTNSTCSTFATVDPAAPRGFVTTWATNNAHTLSLLWDKPNKKVIFSVTSPGKATEVIEALYTLSDSTAPVNDFKRLAAFNSAPNCVGSQNRVLMDATFEDVKTQ